MRRSWLGLALLLLIGFAVVAGIGSRGERARIDGAGGWNVAEPSTPAAGAARTLAAPAMTPAGAAPTPGAPGVIAAGASHQATGPEPSATARGEPSAALEALLATYSREELDLFARFARLNGRAAPPELLELVERRRAGAGRGELIDAASRLFHGDPLARAAALGWARAAGPAGGRAPRE